MFWFGLICGTSSLEGPRQQFQKNNFFVSTKKHKTGYQKKVPIVKKSQKCKATGQIVLFSLKTAISNNFVSLHIQAFLDLRC